MLCGCSGCYNGGVTDSSNDDHDMKNMLLILALSYMALIKPQIWPVKELKVQLELRSSLSLSYYYIFKFN